MIKKELEIGHVIVALSKFADDVVFIFIYIYIYKRKIYINKSYISYISYIYMTMFAMERFKSSKEEIKMTRVV